MLAIIHIVILSKHLEITQKYNLISKDQPLNAINSHEYMLCTGHICIAWMWLKQALLAHKYLVSPEATDDEKKFYLGKISALDYFCNYELPLCTSKYLIINKNPQILDFAEIDWLYINAHN
jgi:hypothetical protein